MKIRSAMLLAFGTASLWATATAGALEYSLTFDPATYAIRTSALDGAAITYRAYEGIVYVQNPVDILYQTINIYIPAEYFEGKSVNGFDAGTAPIFFPNSVGGYMPGAAAKPGEGMDARSGTMLKALAQGLVVAAPGARGRTLTGADGSYTGKAPAAIVDLKAAVRYLRFNDKLMPGNAERIVSNGTSAGGALSALLGATGNNADYAPYLKALGAAEARDDIWAVSSYCPITNLDNADSAYEWLFGELRATKSSSPPLGTMMGGAAPAATVPAATVAGTTGTSAAAGPWGAPQSSGGPLTADQIALSARLKALFPAYVNGLRLKKADGADLTLKADGTGSFRDYVESFLIASAQAALKAGADLSKLAWVTIKNGTVTDIDMSGYVQYAGRKKGVPSFDALDLSSGENNEFGSASVNDKHFTAFGEANNVAAGASSADPVLVRMMNPMGYIGAAGTATSKHWRIRHGAIDSDTANAIPAILATKLANAGFSVDFAIPWDVPHSGDYDLPELFAWIKLISK